MRYLRDASTHVFTEAEGVVLVERGTGVGQRRLVGKVIDVQLHVDVRVELCWKVIINSVLVWQIVIMLVNQHACWQTI